MNKIRQILLMLAVTMVAALQMSAQNKDSKPRVIYGQARNLEIGGISVEGVKGYEDFVLIGLSGLNVGDRIDVPGDEITDAVTRMWEHGLFSNVRIEADSVAGDKVFLKIVLAMRPRVSTINIEGVKKGEREDLEQKIGIIKGNQITPNMVDKAIFITKNYFEDK